MCILEREEYRQNIKHLNRSGYNTVYGWKLAMFILYSSKSRSFLNIIYLTGYFLSALWLFYLPTRNHGD